jgi:hypothetical protein
VSKRNWIRAAILSKSRDAVREIGTEESCRLLMISARKERHRSVEVADPDLGGAGIEIEDTFFVDFGYRIRGRKYFNADLWSVSKDKRFLDNLRAVGRKPGDINGFDAVRRRDRTLCKDHALRKQAPVSSA